MEGAPSLIASYQSSPPDRHLVKCSKVEALNLFSACQGIGPNVQELDLLQVLDHRTERRNAIVNGRCTSRMLILSQHLINAYSQCPVHRVSACLTRGVPRSSDEAGRYCSGWQEKNLNTKYLDIPMRVQCFAARDLALYPRLHSR
jgi:hypothetical protein